MRIKKLWIPMALAGAGILLLSIFYFYRTSVKDTEERLLKTANYMKVQCAAYTHYNEGAETQALLRAVESNKQARDAISLNQESGGELCEELLEQYAKELWLSGILVLDQDGNTVCSYAKDEQLEKKLLENYSLGTILAGDGYTARNYTRRLKLQEGDYINMAATARKDADGMIVTYYYISADCARDYALTLQNLLEGYQLASEGTIMVTDEGKVIACNDSDLIGQNTADNATVQALKANADSKHLMKIRSEKSHGVMLKQRDYYIYAYISDKVIFSNVPQYTLIVMLIYLLIAGVVGTLLKKSDRDHLKLEMQKEKAYKKELLDSAKKADAANVAKTEFLQRMSHDIRTPINGICGMLEVAEYYKDDLGKQAECREKIRNASHLLLELINEVLDMGKLESGEVVLEQQPFDFHDVLEEVVVVIEKLSAERGIELVLDEYQIRHWNLIGSARHVKRLLMNIMSNAVKYNKENGKIVIKCRELPCREKDRMILEFICEDTGIGMSEEYQKKIFEPFTQEDRSVRSRYEGSGLGMPIAKGLAEKMNGTITFESREGEGTTFVVTIPFLIDPDRIEKQEEETKAYSIKNLNILLVEDNELNMEIAEFVLQTEGAIVTKAWNGQEATEIFAGSKPGEYDAILMDVMMPVMDGYQASEKIRSMDRKDAKTVPIIAMTANAFTEDRIKTRKAGMNAHISKPLDISLVIETVCRLTAHEKL